MNRETNPPTRALARRRLGPEASGLVDEADEAAWKSSLWRVASTRNWISGAAWPSSMKEAFRASR